MKGLIHSLALYPVTSRQIREIEGFHELIEAAYAELSDVGAKPYIRLYEIGVSPVTLSLLTFGC